MSFAIRSCETKAGQLFSHKERRGDEREREGWKSAHLSRSTLVDGIHRLDIFTDAVEEFAVEFGWQFVLCFELLEEREDVLERRPTHVGVLENRAHPAMSTQKGRVSFRRR